MELHLWINKALSSIPKGTEIVHFDISLNEVGGVVLDSGTKVKFSVTLLEK